MNDNVDVVNGYKVNRADNFLRRISGNLYSIFTRFIFNLKIRDVDCDFRLIRKKVLDNMTLTKDSGAICVELIRKIQKADFQIIEIPVHHHPRVSGSSTFFNPKSIVKTFWDDFLLFISS